MSRAEDPTARLTDVEIKLAFAEDLLDQLNRQVAAQQEQIEFLVREVVRLREQGTGGTSAGFVSLRDELPPHY